MDLIFEKINTGESNANIEIMKDSDWDDILRLEEGKKKAPSLAMVVHR